MLESASIAPNLASTYVLASSINLAALPLEPRRPTPWANVEEALTRHHHNPDLLAARALYAGFAAHRLSGTPVWIMLVAPPGSMKTELLGGLDRLPGVHFVDHVTPQTFLSGQIADSTRKPSNVSPSLLHRIGEEGVIVMPDFSTMLSGNADKRGAIFSDLRRIYDGQLRKEFGTDDGSEKREWRGRLTVIVAVTPEVDHYTSVFQSLGERFVMVRWPRAGGFEAALAAMNQDRNAVREALSSSVRGLMESLPAIDPEISTGDQFAIANLSELAVISRTAVPREGYSKAITEVPEPESPTRLAQQLAQLAKGSALLDGRELVSTADLDLVRRVAFDCMPPARARILRGLRSGIARKAMGIAPSTLCYALAELEALTLTEGGELSPRARELMTRAGIENPPTVM